MKILEAYLHVLKGTVLLSSLRMTEFVNMKLLQRGCDDEKTWICRYMSCDLDNSRAMCKPCTTEVPSGLLSYTS